MLDQRFISAYALADWQVKYPIIYTIEPLPAHLHTAAGWQPTIIYEHERDRHERLSGTDALMPW